MKLQIEATPGREQIDFIVIHEGAFHTKVLTLAGAETLAKYLDDAIRVSRKGYVEKRVFTLV